LCGSPLASSPRLQPPPRLRATAHELPCLPLAPEEATWRKLRFTRGSTAATAGAVHILCRICLWLRVVMTSCSSAQREQDTNITAPLDVQAMLDYKFTADLVNSWKKLLVCSCTKVLVSSRISTRESVMTFYAMTAKLLKFMKI
jgi:hypothetical protein